MAVAVVVDRRSERHYYPGATATESGGAVVVRADDGTVLAEWPSGEWWALADHDVDPRPAEAEALTPPPEPDEGDDDIYSSSEER